MNSLNTPTSNSPKPKGLTQCWVVWHDGGKKTFQSFNSSGRYEVDDPRGYGIRRLKKMVAKWGDSVARAIIYDNETGQELESLQRGVWVSTGSQ